LKQKINEKKTKTKKMKTKTKKTKLKEKKFSTWKTFGFLESEKIRGRVGK